MALQADSSSMQQTQLTPPNLIGELTPELVRARRSQLQIIVERFTRNRLAVVGLIVLLVMIFMAVLAPIITHTTSTVNPAIDTHPFNEFAPPSAAHIFGTDDVGRDEFARLLFGARVSMTVGVATMLVAIFVGVTIGALAGYYGGWVDNLMMRFTDVFLSVPLLVILSVLSATFSDGSVKSIVLIIGTFSWTVVARIVRADFLSYKQREFLLAARTLGANDLRLILLHILPNAAGPIIVIATLTVGNAILIESTLSFFNFGIQPPNASWGSMLSNSQGYITSDPLLLFLPGLAILVTVLCFNLIGDGLRDALDPYMTER